MLKVDGCAKSGLTQSFIVLVKTGLLVAHALGELTENLGIRFGLAQRRNRRAVEQDIRVAVRRVNIPMLQLRGGGQDVVGVIRRIGLEVLQHHGEQVFSGKTFDDLAGVGRDRHGVAVVNDERFDFGAKLGRAGTQQIIANRHHVEGARRLRH